MVQNEYFALTVNQGSEILFGNGSRLVLNEIPKNALELWSQGKREFVLKKEGVALLEKHSKEDLEKLIEVRTNVNFPAEIKLLTDLLKSKTTAKTTKKNEIEK